MGHATHILLDDRTLIQFTGDVVGGGADNFYAALFRLMIGLGADEGRQKGVVDVDDPTLPSVDKIRREDLHVASQDHDLDPQFAQQRFLPGFAGRFVGGHRKMMKR